MIDKNEIRDKLDDLVVYAGRAAGMISLLTTSIHSDDTVRRIAKAALQDINFLTDQLRLTRDRSDLN